MIVQQYKTQFRRSPTDFDTGVPGLGTFIFLSNKSEEACGFVNNYDPETELMEITLFEPKEIPDELIVGEPVEAINFCTVLDSIRPHMSPRTIDAWREALKHSDTVPHE